MCVISKWWLVTQLGVKYFLGVEHSCQNTFSYSLTSRLYNKSCFVIIRHELVEICKESIKIGIFQKSYVGSRKVRQKKLFHRWCFVTSTGRKIFSRSHTLTSKLILPFVNIQALQNNLFRVHTTRTCWDM